METNLLVIEDEPEFADYLRRGLTYEGYRVRVTLTAEAGLEQLRQSQPDLIILDVMLPGIDGMAACRRLRTEGYLGPVLMLTARDAVSDRVSGLNSGADDYLAKPFAFEELLARLRALLRRAGPTQVITFADLELDLGLRAVRRRGQTIALTRTEYDLLGLFLKYPGQTLSREMLVESLWKLEHDHGANALDVYVSRLRRKLGNPPLIQTRYGIGYVLHAGPG